MHDWLQLANDKSRKPRDRFCGLKVEESFERLVQTRLAALCSVDCPVGVIRQHAVVSQRTDFLLSPSSSASSCKSQHGMVIQTDNGSHHIFTANIRHAMTLCTKMLGRWIQSIPQRGLHSAAKTPETERQFLCVFNHALWHGKREISKTKRPLLWV